MGTFLRAALFCAVLIFCAGVAAQSPPPDVRVGDLRAKLGRELNQIAASFDGVMGIAVKDFSTGDVLAVNADTMFPQASSIKVTVLIELLRQSQAGTLKLDERVEPHRAQFVGGSGVLQGFADGTSSLSLHDLGVLMINLSDNTATNILIDRLGMAKVNDTLAALRLSQTRLERRGNSGAGQGRGETVGAGSDSLESPWQRHPSQPASPLWRLPSIAAIPDGLLQITAGARHACWNAPGARNNCRRGVRCR